MLVVVYYSFFLFLTIFYLIIRLCTCYIRNY